MNTTRTELGSTTSASASDLPADEQQRLDVAIAKVQNLAVSSTRAEAWTEGAKVLQSVFGAEEVAIWVFEQHWEIDARDPHSLL